ncbi:hypothetical protein [Thermomonospora cellulosilytica]|uniref:Uncharacterized protein n=1 Tax=Thermomonospora cellulosilytica TaxID=1411118 RepID=A0A7W3R7H3_9ACTN|nr:hypothetical protein [Thermomonospora cellulosilytica]MBA9003208.1 hypothetical protein [Thermomonospora cellulosilytica]
MRRIVMALVTAGIIIGGSASLTASSAAADETGSVRITNRAM